VYHGRDGHDIAHTPGPHQAGLMKNLLLKHKLFIALCIVVIIFSCILLVLVDVHVKKLIIKESMRDGSVVVTTMALHIETPLVTHDFDTISKYFDDILRANSHITYLFVVQPDGQIPIHTFHKSVPREVLDLRHKKDVLDHVLLKTPRGTYIDFSAPVLEGKAGTLRLGIDERVSEDAVHDLAITILLIASGVMACSFLVSIFIARTLTRPLTDLTTSAMEVAEGDYKKIVRVSGRDEVGMLANAFNKMITAVQSREKELVSLNEELEMVNVRLHEYIDKLREATDELVRSKQDAAVVDTARAFLHHLRQPLTYLTMAIELLTDELAEDSPLDYASSKKKLDAIMNAGERLTELLNKFEALESYKIIEFDHLTKIVDIEDRTES
jgi:HAMP domain-containing protein